MSTEPDRTVALDRAAGGSPYRTFEAGSAVERIAGRRHSWTIDVLLIGFVAMTPWIVMVGDALSIGFFVFWAVWLGFMRVRFLLGGAGTHRIDANAHGLRLRCSDAALTQTLAVAHPRQVDLFVPWDECRSIVARPYQFGDDTELALVITTDEGEIAVRPGIFELGPAALAARLLGARDRLALPSPH